MRRFPRSVLIYGGAGGLKNKLYLSSGFQHQRPPWGPGRGLSRCAFTYITEILLNLVLSNQSTLHPKQAELIYIYTLPLGLPFRGSWGFVVLPCNMIIAKILKNIQCYSNTFKYIYIYRVLSNEHFCFQTVTPTDHPKSVRNRCVIELFCGVFYVVTLPF